MTLSLFGQEFFSIINYDLSIKRQNQIRFCFFFPFLFLGSFLNYYDKQEKKKRKKKTKRGNKAN